MEVRARPVIILTSGDGQIAGPAVPQTIGYLPHMITWGRHRLLVSEVLDEWRFGGRWWQDERPRDCYHVRCSNGWELELHRVDDEEGAWWLTRIQD